MSDFETVPRGTVDELERLREELDTLAAHVERLSEAADELADLMDGVREGDYTPDSFTNQPMRAILAEAPATSLARLKAKWQAEALRSEAILLYDSLQHTDEQRAISRRIADILRSKADSLERQAEGGEV